MTYTLVVAVVAGEIYSQITPAKIENVKNRVVLTGLHSVEEAESYRERIVNKLKKLQTD